MTRICLPKVSKGSPDPPPMPYSELTHRRKFFFYPFLCPFVRDTSTWVHPTSLRTTRHTRTAISDKRDKKYDEKVRFDFQMNLRVKQCLRVIQIIRS